MHASQERTVTPEEMEALHADEPRKRNYVNPAALKIEDGVPVPDNPHRESRWVPILKALKVGQSVHVPGTTRAKLGYVRKIARSVGITLKMMPTDDGVRMWRMADSDTDVSPAAETPAETPAAPTAAAPNDDGL